MRHELVANGVRKILHREPSEEVVLGNDYELIDEVEDAAAITISKSDGRKILFIVRPLKKGSSEIVYWAPTLTQIGFLAELRDKFVEIELDNRAHRKREF